MARGRRDDLPSHLACENTGNLGARAENTHVQTAFVAIDDAAFFIYVKS